MNTLSYNLENELIKFWRFNFDTLEYYKKELKAESKIDLAEQLFEAFYLYESKQNYSLNTSLIKFVNCINSFVYEITIDNLKFPSTKLPYYYNHLQKVYNISESEKHLSRIKVCDDLQKVNIIEYSEFSQYVYDVISDPEQIKLAYNLELNNCGYNKLNTWQIEALESSFTKQSFVNELDGGDFLLPGLCLKHIRKNGQSFDSFTSRMLMDYNIEIEPFEVAQFLYSVYAGFISIRKSTDLAEKLARKYKQISGKSINEKVKIEQIENNNVAPF